MSLMPEDSNGGAVPPSTVASAPAVVVESAAPPSEEDDAAGNTMSVFRVPLPPEEFETPMKHRARRDLDVLLEDGSSMKMYLARERETPDQPPWLCYSKFPKKEKLRGGEKGYILYGRAYELVVANQNNTMHPHRYRETNRVVVMKKLSKKWLSENKSENPDHEISAAQSVGDNHHVIEIVEALEDDKYLYMVMPYLGQDLLRCMWNGSPHLNRLMATLVKNLQYLQLHRLIHRDLSPENVIVHMEMHEDCCPLIDMAMALRLTTLEGHTQKIAGGQTPCGKLPYMAPEVFRAEVLDHGVDVWSLGCLLFHVWVRGEERLYDSPMDRSYVFFIRERALQRVELLDTMLQLLLANQARVPPEFLALTKRIPLVKNLSYAQRDLLSRMLQEDPRSRITLQEIWQHEFMENYNDIGNNNTLQQVPPSTKQPPSATTP